MSRWIVRYLGCHFRWHGNIMAPDHPKMTEFRQPIQVQSHLEMPGILVQLGHIQRT